MTVVVSGATFNVMSQNNCYYSKSRNCVAVLGGMTTMPLYETYVVFDRDNESTDNFAFTLTTAPHHIPVTMTSGGGNFYSR